MTFKRSSHRSRLWRSRDPAKEASCSSTAASESSCSMCSLTRKGYTRVYDSMLAALKGAMIAFLASISTAFVLVCSLRSKWILS